MQSDKRIVDGIGLWLENLTLGNWRGRSGLFLDRDGVLLEEVGFLGRPEDVRMIDGSADIVRWANNLAVPVIIVTNQSGIGRRYYNWQDFLSVQTELYRNLALVGAHIDLVAACAYHADAAPPYRVADHPWRKPNAGMIHAVAAESGLDLSCSALIGDRWSDIEAAAKAGMAHGIMVKTGYGSKQAENQPNCDGSLLRVDIVPDLECARGMLESCSWPISSGQSPDHTAVE